MKQAEAIKEAPSPAIIKLASTSITSKEKARLFVERMEQHCVEKKRAENLLREWGIEISRLPEK